MTQEDNSLEIALKALMVTKSLLRTERNGQIIEVWQASQHLGGLENNDARVKAWRYVNGCQFDSFATEAEALNWIVG